MSTIVKFERLCPICGGVLEYKAIGMHGEEGQFKCTGVKDIACGFMVSFFNDTGRADKVANLFEQRITETQYPD